MEVLPVRVLDARRVDLADGQGDRDEAPRGRVAVDRHLREVVVREPRLQLAIRRQQRSLAPHGQPRELLRRVGPVDPLVRLVREAAPLQRIEAEAPARELQVVLDVRRLARQLVGLHLEALDERGIELSDQERGQHRGGRGTDHEPATVLPRAPEDHPTRSHGDDRERLHRGQARLRVGEAEDPLHLRGAAQEEDGAPQPEPPREEEEEDRDQRPEVDAGELLRHDPSPTPAQRAGGRVPGRRQREEEEHDHEEEDDGAPQHRHPEDVERHVPPEDRLGEPPRDAMHQEEGLQPHRRRDRRPEPESEQAGGADHRPEHVAVRQLLGDLQVGEAALDLDATQRGRGDLEVEVDREPDRRPAQDAPAPLPRHPTPEDAFVADVHLPEDLGEGRGPEPAEGEQQARHEHQRDQESAAAERREEAFHRHAPTALRPGSGASPPLPPRISLRRAWVRASKRATITGCVLDERRRAHPSPKRTRTPSTSITS